MRQSRKQLTHTYVRLFIEAIRPNTFATIIAIDPVISTVDLELVLQGKIQSDGSRDTIPTINMVKNVVLLGKAVRKRLSL
jgi:hypothetical protein